MFWRLKKSKAQMKMDLEAWLNLSAGVMNSSLFWKKKQTLISQEDLFHLC